MPKIHCPEILDSWLFVLSQLATDKYVQRGNIRTPTGRVAQPPTLALLREARLVDSATKQRDGVKGYYLCRPLSEVPFSELVNLWSQSSMAYSRRLFLRYGHLSLADVLSLPILPTSESDVSLDKIFNTLKILTYNMPKTTQTLMSIGDGYPHHPIRLLHGEGIVKRVSGEGYALAKPKHLITLGDITPVVSTKNNTLAKILRLAKDEPITTLFRKN